MERNPEEYSAEEKMAEIVGESYLQDDHAIDREFIRWKRQADQGGVEAQIRVARAYLEGVLVKRSEKEATRYYELASEEEEDG